MTGELTVRAQYHLHAQVVNICQELVEIAALMVLLVTCVVIHNLIHAFNVENAKLEKLSSQVLFHTLTKQHVKPVMLILNAKTIG